METVRQKTVNRPAALQPAAAAKAVQRKAAPPWRPLVQASLKVSSPADPAEKEAESAAKKIMRINAPRTIPSGAESPSIRRFADSGALLKKGELFRSATGPVRSDTAAEIGSATSGGAPLPTGVRSFMEPRFGADFGNVRIHTGDRAATLSRQLNARAFTTSNHIFFARGSFQPDTGDGKELIAHELTHTIQQGAAVHRSVAKPLVTQSSPPMVQRLGMSDALGYFAEKANLIPGFRMFTIILGVNPVNMCRVERSPANILRAMVEFLPGGGLVVQTLDNHGVFDKVGRWVEQQIAALGMTGAAIREAVTRFLDSLGWRDVLNLGDVWSRAQRILTEPIGRIIAFARGLITGILRFVKEAILRPLARLAEGTRGYDLLKAVLGEDPVTGDPVPRNADTLIGGLMKLIGQEEVWQNLKKANAVARAWTWFQGAMASLLGFVRQVPSLFLKTLQSLEIADIVLVPRAFAKVAGVFGDFVGKFFSWAGSAVWNLLEIVFEVLAPAAIPYMKKAAGAFRTILRNPVGFVGNLVRAGKLGFEMFAGNILEHLKAALIKWLVGPLAEAGVHIPKSFSLMEIVKLVLSVLGLTWQNIRSKLVKIIPEPVLVVLEKTAGILVTLAKEGPAAAWEQIKAELTELKDQLISQITEMISVEVVKAAVTKLVSMLNPAGAVVQAILAIYNTITFFIDKIQQIAAVVASFIDSLAAIAAGQVQGAAKKVEQTMAGTLTVVIAFLAKFAGLGNIPAKLVGIVKKVRQPIDKGLDRIVDWLGNMLKKIGGAVKAGVKRLLNWWKKKKPVIGGGEQHTLTFEGSDSRARLVLRSAPEKPSEFLDSAAKRKKISADRSRHPKAIAVTHEAAIDGLLGSLREIDDNPGPTAAGAEAKRADGLAEQLDQKMETLGGHIVATLNTWGVDDAEIKDVDLPRGSFTVDQKRGIAKQHKNKSELRENSAKEPINLQKGLARRHVVSSYDMARHYAKVLNGKRVSQGKLLLEQRCSITSAQTVVEELTSEGIRKAAKSRYGVFFGYLKNMFIGDSKENSSIQECLDRGNPELAGKKLYEHVSHVKRAWALDKTIEISGLDKD